MHMLKYLLSAVHFEYITTSNLVPYFVCYGQ